MEDNNFSEWWTPQSLQESEQKTRQIDKISNLDSKNDFGSYRKVLLGEPVKRAQLGQHNDLNPIRKLRTLEKFTSIGSSRVILDVGCGAGFTTNALDKHFDGARVIGIDISHDAIEFASQTFNGPEFRCLAISPDSQFEDVFDLIACFEFYPFTRSNDANIHKAFISMLVRHLSKSGKLIIFQKWPTENSLSETLNLVEEAFQNFEFTLTQISNPRLGWWLPKTLSMVATKTLERITKKKLFRYLLVIEASNTNQLQQS